jgi:hypothetical protein
LRPVSVLWNAKGVWYQDSFRLCPDCFVCARNTFFSATLLCCFARREFLVRVKGEFVGSVTRKREHHIEGAGKAQQSETM